MRRVSRTSEGPEGEAFRRYLEPKPDAKDARQICEYLGELGG